MLIFGHIGITLGSVILLNGVFKSIRPVDVQVNRQKCQPLHSPEERSYKNYTRRGNISRFISLPSWIDIRLLLIGSLLPDLIDKPVGQIFFVEYYSNGRIFSHTLVFLIIISLAGLFLYHIKKKTWILVLSIGTLFHLILDQMWLTPQTLLWPLDGFSFEKVDLGNWAQDILREFLADPITYVSEIVGVIIVIWFVLIVMRRQKLPTPSGNGQD